jgi:capsular exopolysaccharide synthesis family protein
MDLRQIVRTVRAHWIIALVVFLVCAFAGAAYAVLPAKQYQATVVLLAQPPANAADPGSDVGAIQVEIPQIVVEADNPVIASEARSNVPARFRSVSATVVATGDPVSNSVTITASSTDPAAAQAYADATAARVLKLTNNVANSTLTLSELASAQLPTSPTNPGKTVLVAAVAFGVIAAVFAALGAAVLRRRFVTADEIRDRIGLTVLAEVPVLVHPGAGPAVIFESTADQGGLEAFQQLRSYLHLMFPDANPTIAVTSCDAREGKSSVSSHMAWALATAGRSVVAVDGDLRKPMLHEMFGLALSPGVSDFSNVGLSGLLNRTRNRFLQVIPAGVPERHPADIVAADVPRLLSALHESDRTVVLDCPPLTGVAETKILVAKADAVVLVVDARKFDPERLEHGLAQLRTTGTDIVGIVLNRVRRRRLDADYGYYGPNNGKPNNAKPNNADADANGDATRTKHRWLARSK